MSTAKKFAVGAHIFTKEEMANFEDGNEQQLLILANRAVNEFREYQKSPHGLADTTGKILIGFSETLESPRMVELLTKYKNNEAYSSQDVKDIADRIISACLTKIKSEDDKNYLELAKNYREAAQKEIEAENQAYSYIPHNVRESLLQHVDAIERDAHDSDLPVEVAEKIYACCSTIREELNKVRSNKERVNSKIIEICGYFKAASKELPAGVKKAVYIAALYAAFSVGACDSRILQDAIDTSGSVLPLNLLKGGIDSD